MILWCDFETRSHCDLKKHGVYNYAQDAATDVLCMSYAFDDEDVVTWLPTQPFPERVRNHTGKIHAHNAAFERLIFWYVLQINFELEQFYCTATQARANCAPGSLEDVGRFAGASMKKDYRGAQLIRALCIPPFKDDPALMAELVQYCEQDVRAMRAVSQSLRPLSDEELEDYHVNEKINDRGVLVDVALASAAISYAAIELEDIQSIVRDVTDGAITSVRSPKMREWVKERLSSEHLKLMEVEDGKYSIDKRVRANLLATSDLPPDVAEVIQCADDLWASSVAKFSRLKDLADVEDNRVRGAFVFAGGSATGRASSYGAQVHNFTRKCAKAPESVRDAMVHGQLIVPIFGKRVTDVLKGMLRPAIIPSKGKSLVVADWSQIEARMTPWLSGRGDDVLDVFRSGRDIYVREAAAMYKIPEDQVTPDQRQIGKVAILACFTSKTKVLTNNGVKAIVEVKLTDKLWDGESWVSHEGVISKGWREVINVCGMEVTPDHLIKTQTTWQRADQLVLNRYTRRQALATGSASLPFLELKGINTARAFKTWLGFNVLVAQTRTLLWITTCVKESLRGATFVLKKHPVTGARIILNTPKRALMTPIGGDCLIGCQRVKTDVTIQTILRTRITGAEASNCIRLGKPIKHRFCAMWLGLKVGIRQVLNWTGSTLTKGMNLAIYGSLQSKQTLITNAQYKSCKPISLNLKPVFDILNSGVNHRFTVVTDEGALIVHNCGFGGGLGAFSAMGRAYGLSMTESDAQRTVDAWRRANQWAVRYWQELELGYTTAMRHKGREIVAGRVTYLFDGQSLWYALPSGRILCYPYAKLEEDGISYAKAAWKPAADAREWPRARLWRGLACENITQAAANDVLRYALRQLDGVVLHVHDEIVIETDQPEVVTEQLRKVMCTPPAWAQGLPLDAEIQTMARYGK